MSEKAWFQWYMTQTDKVKKWASYRGKYLCPCCFMPTLDERASFEICPLCFWEDDGQDSDDADLVRGGPNGRYSLSEARANFANYHTMYRPDDTRPFQREMAGMTFRKQLYALYVQAIKDDDVDTFQKALALQQSL